MAHPNVFMFCVAASRNIPVSRCDSNRTTKAVNCIVVRYLPDSEVVNAGVETAPAALRGSLMLFND